MPQFFTNLQIRTQDTQAVPDALADLFLEPAWMSEARGGWVAVFPEETEIQDFARLAYLSAQASERLHTAVVALLVHDGELFCCWLYDGGTLIDAFQSNPDYFEPPPPAERRKYAGRADRMLPYCLPGTRLFEVDALLHPPPLEDAPPIPLPPLGLPGPDPQEMNALADAILANHEALHRRVEQAARQRYLFAGEQAAHFARLFGIDPTLACLGARSLDSVGELFIRIGPPSPGFQV